MKKILAIILFLCIFFAACDDGQEEDYSIGEITITGIPAQIPVLGNESVKNNTYKVYLNASDSMKENEPPAAKGVMVITPAMKQDDGTYTVVIKLQKPNPADEPDPNYDTGPWRGTANYFSVMISPDTITADGANAIWAKGGTTLNKGKARYNWETKGFMDFRDPALSEAMEFPQKTKALYDDIVYKDPEIKPWPRSSSYVY